MGTTHAYGLESYAHFPTFRGVCTKVIWNFSAEEILLFSIYLLNHLYINMDWFILYFML